MEDTTPVEGVAQVPETPSLGQVGHDAYYQALGMPDASRWDQSTAGDQTAWHAAAGAVVIAYDTSLYQQAEDQAQLLGLEPQPLPDITPPANL